MKIKERFLNGLLLLEPSIFQDVRGYFYESYNQNTFEQLRITETFLQDNQSFSSRGTVRGLHYQLPPMDQGKLVRVLQGEILDVAVDIRLGSPTFGEYISVKLSGENHYLLWIPSGFAHGFSVLSETALLLYKCTNLYSRKHERGIAWNDPQININWQVQGEPLLSDKDKTHPCLKDVPEQDLFHFDPR